MRGELVGAAHLAPLFPLVVFDGDRAASSGVDDLVLGLGETFLGAASEVGDLGK
jgi:hypothetical protein